jgi:C-terminal peptidase prc
MVGALKWRRWWNAVIVVDIVLLLHVASHDANAFLAGRRGVIYPCTSSTTTTTTTTTRTQSHRQHLLSVIARRRSSVSIHNDNIVVATSSIKHHHLDSSFVKDAESFLAMQASSTKRTTRNATTARLAATAVLVASILFAPIQFLVETTVSTTTIAPTTTNVMIPQKIVIVARRSEALALTESQMLVDSVWKEVTRQFVDQSFNGLGEDAWRKKRLEAVMKVVDVGPDEQQQVYDIIRKMLSCLGDPYTRFLSPEQFETLTSFAKGTMTGNGGIGVQLIEDPATGRIVVLNTIPGSPAEKGGIRPGDVIFEVDYMNMESATAEVVAAKCRGDAGTEVSLAVKHGGDGKMANGELTRVALVRQVVKPRQVETSMIVLPDSGKKIGVIQIPSFSLETEKQVREALGAVKKNKSTSAIAIDLRGNVGGYMPAGVDTAKLFLSPQARIVSEVDKSGRATFYVNDGVGGSDTNIPL